LAICISARVAVATPTTAREIEKQQQQQNKWIISHSRALFRPAILRLVYPFYYTIITTELICLINNISCILFQSQQSTHNTIRLCNKNKIQVSGSNSFDTKFSDYLHILVRLFRIVFISISQSFHLAGERLALLVCYKCLCMRLNIL
jgi:hypothetical protein